MKWVYRYRELPSAENYECDTAVTPGVIIRSANPVYLSLIGQRFLLGLQSQMQSEAHSDYIYI
jgi:hypothetical protein